MSLLRRAGLFLLCLPQKKASLPRAGHLRQAFVGPHAEEISAILSPFCQHLRGRAVLLGADRRIRAGVSSAHQRLAIAHEPLVLLLKALLGPKGLLLLGRPLIVPVAHVALPWKIPVAVHLMGDIAHTAAAN